MSNFTLKQLFSIVDGRLSTKMEDVYEILNAATSQNLQTIQLSWASDMVVKHNPIWYEHAKIKIDSIKYVIGEDFQLLMDYIDKNCSGTVFNVTKIESL